MPTSKQILKYSLIFCTLLFAFLSWRALFRSINIAEASSWLAPTIWFSLFFVAFALSIVLIKERLVLEILSLVSLLFSTIYLLDFWNLLAIILSFLFISLGIGQIRKDLKLNIKVDLWKSIRAGSSFIIFALSLAITSNYFLSIKDFSTERLIPKFKMEGLTSALTSNVLSAVNPNFKKIDDGGMTVDDLILASQKNQMPEENLPAAATAQMDQAVLAEGRKQLSSMAGMDLTGQEKVSDVLSGVIDKKINSFVAPDLSGGQGFPLIPAVMAFLILLTVISLGLFLCTFWILFIRLVFYILRQSKVVTISKIPAEIEVIE